LFTFYNYIPKKQKSKTILKIFAGKKLSGQAHLQQHRCRWVRLPDGH